MINNLLIRRLGKKHAAGMRYYSFFDAHPRRWEVVVFHLVVVFTLPPIINHGSGQWVLPIVWFSTLMIMDIMGERVPFLLLASCYLGLGAVSHLLALLSLFLFCMFSLCALLFHLR